MSLLNMSPILGTSKLLKSTLVLLTYPALGILMYFGSVIPVKSTSVVVGHKFCCFTPIGFLRKRVVSSMSINIASSFLSSAVISYSRLEPVIIAMLSSVVTLILKEAPGTSPKYAG